MVLIGQHHYHHQKPWTVDDLSERLNIGAEACNLLVTNLVNAGMLIPVAGEVAAYVPAQALETLKLKDLFTAIRRAGETTYLRSDNLPQVTALDELYGDMETAIDRILEGKTLRDLSLSEIGIKIGN
jgi:DNA-binding IscR family transcriptional regulator